jgi:hypothetical protein
LGFELCVSLSRPTHLPWIEGELGSAYVVVPLVLPYPRLRRR